LQNWPIRATCGQQAKVAKLADAPDLGNEKTGFQIVSKSFKSNGKNQSKIAKIAIWRQFPEGK
jgi:hypothetical protein